MKNSWQRARAGDEGFTLIELLMAIVVVAILTVVAIVGVDGLTNNGSKSACKATMDAAKGWRVRSRRPASSHRRRARCCAWVSRREPWTSS